MTIYLINNKPYVAVQNGFRAIPTLLYRALLERGEIKHTEVIEDHD